MHLRLKDFHKHRFDLFTWPEYVPTSALGDKLREVIRQFKNTRDWAKVKKENRTRQNKLRFAERSFGVNRDVAETNLVIR